MFAEEDCPQCGEPTEVFRDGVCSDCSRENQQEIDEFLHETDRWARLSEAEKDRAIRDKIRYAEHFTEPDDDGIEEELEDDA